MYFPWKISGTAIVIWPEFIKLKTAIGGNREQLHYEESFGLPLEEQLYITVPNKHIKRLISQLEFAIRLNEENSGTFAHRQYRHCHLPG